MKKPKGKIAQDQIARLNEIFKELGFKKLEYSSRNRFDAYVQQEDEGTSNQLKHPRAIRKENSCGKACFTSKAKAKEGINYRLKRGADTGKLRAYFCDICKAWHMTKSFHIK